MIKARNLQINTFDPSRQSSIGGRVGSVGARGWVAGLIRVEHSVQRVHGGGEVTAETVSPSVGSVTANDAVLAGWADPQVPESIRDQVLAEAAAVYDQLLGDRLEMADEIEAAIAAFAEQKAAALAKVGEHIASVDQMLQEAREEVQAQWQLVVERMENSLCSSANSTYEMLEAIQEEAEKLLAELVKEIDQLKAEANEAYVAADEHKALVLKKLQEFDRRLEELCAKDAADAALAREAWHAQTRDELVAAWFGNHEEGWSWDLETILARIQLGLDVGGLFPGYGEPLDGINGVISPLRGRWLEAALSFAAMIPAIGWGATAAKWGKKADNAFDISRLAPRGAEWLTDAMKGFKDGEIFPDSVLQRLSSRLNRNNTSIIKNEWAQEILEKTGDGAQFVRFKDGSAGILLRPNATRYQLVHELKHYEHWLADRAKYAKLGKLEREEFVFKALQESNHWRLFTDAERGHASEYIEYIRRLYGN